MMDVQYLQIIRDVCIPHNFNISSKTHYTFEGCGFCIFMAQSEVENVVTDNTQPFPITNSLKSQSQKSILTHIWNGFFRSKNENFEKILEHLSKE